MSTSINPELVFKSRCSKQGWVEKSYTDYDFLRMRIMYGVTDIKGNSSLIRLMTCEPPDKAITALKNLFNSELLMMTCGIDQ